MIHPASLRGVLRLLRDPLRSGFYSFKFVGARLTVVKWAMPVRDWARAVLTR